MLAPHFRGAPADVAAATGGEATTGWGVEASPTEATTGPTVAYIPCGPRVGTSAVVVDGAVAVPSSSSSGKSSSVGLLSVLLLSGISGVVPFPVSETVVVADGTSTGFVLTVGARGRVGDGVGSSLGVMVGISGSSSRTSKVNREYQYCEPADKSLKSTTVTSKYKVAFVPASVLNEKFSRVFRLLSVCVRPRMGATQAVASFRIVSAASVTYKVTGESAIATGDDSMRTNAPLNPATVLPAGTTEN